MAKFPRGRAATKALIVSCASNGVGIEGLPDAPYFRFIPRSQQTDWAGKPLPCKTELVNGPPSRRGSVPGYPPKPKNIKNWTPPSLSLDTNYNVPMKGDSRAMTKARAAWHNGDPAPLRQLLSKHRERECVAA